MVSEKLKFLWRNSDAPGSGGRGTSGASDRTTFTAPANVARTQAPRPPHHLHFAIMAPHDDAAGVGLATFARVTYQEHDSETIGPETEDACAMIIG